jgi:hypothetical protein
MTYLCQFPGILIHQRRVDLNLSWSESGSSDEFKCTVSAQATRRVKKRHGSYYRYNSPNKLPRKPKEGLLEVVVGLGRNLEVLEILLAMECHRASLHLSLLKS